MAYFTSPLVTEYLGMDPLLADTIGVALLILIVVAILKVLFGNTPGRVGASEMRPHIGGYQPRHNPPEMQRPPISSARPSRPPPPKPILSRQQCIPVCRGCMLGEHIPPSEAILPKPPLRRCPPKGFGEPIECSECDRRYNCPKKD